MLQRLKGIGAPFLALALLSAGVLQASSQTAPPAPAPVAEAAASAVAPAMTSEDLNAWLDGFMPFAINNADIVGAVITVVRDGQVIANRGYGYADLETRTPVDPNATLFRPGSISKLFTWTAVMQQVEAGHIDLDADVNQYIDYEIPAYNGQPITMRNIMTHTTGFEEVVRDLIVEDPAAGDIALGDYLKSNLPARIAAPGTMPAYSNYATALAGYIVERVADEPFDDYIQHHIFDPLGMTHSSFMQPLPESMQGAMSGGYRNGADGEALPFEIIPAGPAGALSSTGADMALFMAAHLNNGAGLLQPETARIMHETIDQQFPGVDSMALGFYQEDVNGQRILAHGGDTQYFHSNLTLLMDQNVGVFVSFNSGGNHSMGGTLLRWELIERFADRYYPVTHAPVGDPIETAQAHGAAAVGDYESSRRIQTSPLAAIYFLGQTTVSMLPNGDLVGPGLPDLNSEPKHWREVEPYVWQATSGDERMGARVDDNGNISALAAEPLSFAIEYVRAPWYRSKSLLLPLLGAAIAVFMLTFVSWPVRAIARVGHAKAFPYEGVRARAHRIGAVSSLLVVVYLLSWIGFVTYLMETLSANTGGGMTPFLMVLYIAGLVPILATAGLAYANFSLWRAPSSWFAKIWGALLLLSAFVVLWFAVVMNFFSFVFRY